MEGGPSKINPSNSHPSNTIHKVANPESTTPPTVSAPGQQMAQKIEPTASDKTPTVLQHEITKQLSL